MSVCPHRVASPPGHSSSGVHIEPHDATMFFAERACFSCLVPWTLHALPRSAPPPRPSASLSPYSELAQRHEAHLSARRPRCEGSWSGANHTMTSPRRPHPASERRLAAFLDALSSAFPSNLNPRPMATPALSSEGPVPTPLS